MIPTPTQGMRVSRPMWRRFGWFYIRTLVGFTGAVLIAYFCVGLRYGFGPLLLDAVRREEIFDICTVPIVALLTTIVVFISERFEGK